jgi:hypothetical protein
MKKQPKRAALLPMKNGTSPAYKKAKKLIGSGNKITADMLQFVVEVHQIMSHKGVDKLTTIETCMYLYSNKIITDITTHYHGI